MKFVNAYRYHLKNTPKREIIKLIFMNFSFLINWILFKNQKVGDINKFEKQIYSQNGEDGILQIIFYKIGTTNKYYVEFGVEDGEECNTRYLKDNFKWHGLWMDAHHEGKLIKKEWVTKDNIEKLFKKYKVPNSFDLLSIDIDGNDYWIWDAIKKYNPRVVVIEYNSMFPPPQRKVVKYDSNFIENGTDYFGASISALNKLAQKKGYRLIGCENRGVNAFFVKEDLIKGNFIVKDEKYLYKKPQFGIKKNDVFIGYKKSNKRMLKV